MCRSLLSTVTAAPALHYRAFFRVVYDFMRDVREVVPGERSPCLQQGAFLPPGRRAKEGILLTHRLKLHCSGYMLGEITGLAKQNLSAQTKGRVERYPGC